MLEARKLKKMDITGASDPYVKLKLFDAKVILFIFPVWLTNRLISAGLELVLSHTESLLHRNTDNFPRIYKLIARAFSNSDFRANKTVFNIIFHFNIRENLYIIRCDI